MEPKDIRIDTWCSRRSNWLANSHDTCRLTHLPTGIIVERTSRSIHKAKAEAMHALELLVAEHVSKHIVDTLAETSTYYSATQTLQ